MSTFKHIDVLFTVFGLQMVVKDRMVVLNLGLVVHNQELVDHTAVVRIVAVLLCTPLSGWITVPTDCFSTNHILRITISLKEEISYVQCMSIDPNLNLVCMFGICDMQMMHSYCLQLWTTSLHLDLISLSLNSIKQDV